MKTSNTGLRRLFRVACPASLLLIAGCANYPEPDNIRFGESVRHAIALQTTDPNAGALGLDGEKAVGVLREYRGFVGSPEAITISSETVDF